MIATGRFSVRQSSRWCRQLSLFPSKKQIQVTFKVPHYKQEIKVAGPPGASLKTLIQEHPELNAMMECSCDGNAACSTCHVIVEPTFFSKMDKPDEFEMDMIDLAYDPQETSRLGCQVFLTDDLDGLVVTVPEKSNDMH